MAQHIGPIYATDLLERMGRSMALGRSSAVQEYDRHRSIPVEWPLVESARAQPVASDFARLILSRGLLLYLETDWQVVENARGHFGHFFQMRLEIAE